MEQESIIDWSNFREAETEGYVDGHWREWQWICIALRDHQGQWVFLFLWFWYNVMDEWIPKKYVPTKEQVNFFMVWYGVAWYKMMLRRAFETWSTPTTFLTRVQPSIGRSTTVGNLPRSCIVMVENLHEAFFPTFKCAEWSGARGRLSRVQGVSHFPSHPSTVLWIPPGVQKVWKVINQQMKVWELFQAGHRRGPKDLERGVHGWLGEENDRNGEFFPA